MTVYFKLKTVYFQPGPYIFGPRPYIFRQDRIYCQDRIFSRTVYFTFQDRIFYYLIKFSLVINDKKDSCFLVKAIIRHDSVKFWNFNDILRFRVREFSNCLVRFTQAWTQFQGEKSGLSRNWQSKKTKSSFCCILIMFKWTNSLTLNQLVDAKWYWNNH